jgi:peptidoglycan biosynthesis protein MviN/MurJ (putative lipid II flippase)
MYTNFIAGIYIKERNKVLPFITGLGAAVNIIVNIVLIPPLGIMGAALATLAAYMVMAFAIYLQAQKAYRIEYEWGRVRLLFIVVGISYGLERLAVGAELLTSSSLILLLRIGLSAVAIGALFFGGFFSTSERLFLKEKLFPLYAIKKDRRKAGPV